MNANYVVLCYHAEGKGLGGDNELCSELGQATNHEKNFMFFWEIDVRTTRVGIYAGSIHFGHGKKGQHYSLSIGTASSAEFMKFIY